MRLNSNLFYFTGDIHHRIYIGSHFGLFGPINEISDKLNMIDMNLAGLRVSTPY